MQYHSAICCLATMSDVSVPTVCDRQCCLSWSMTHITVGAWQTTIGDKLTVLLGHDTEQSRQHLPHCWGRPYTTVGAGITPLLVQELHHCWGKSYTIVGTRQRLPLGQDSEHCWDKSYITVGAGHTSLLGQDLEHCWEKSYRTVGAGHTSLLGQDLEHCWDKSYRTVGAGHTSLLGQDLEHCWDKSYRTVGAGLTHHHVVLAGNSWLLKNDLPHLGMSLFSQCHICVPYKQNHNLV